MGESSCGQPESPLPRFLLSVRPRLGSMMNTSQSLASKPGTGESGDARTDSRFSIPASRFGSRGHYELDAWKVSRKLVSAIYRLTQTFPREEQFGLAAQMRRASVSIPSNIAEGAARTGSREYAHFLNVARGSASELETQLFIASDLGYIESDHAIFSMVDRVSKLVTGLHKTIRNR
ncbi:MAG: four helix bundle protein [Gammaproteobacteria bacterium]